MTENDTPEDLKRRKIQRIIIVIGMALAILAAVGNIITGLKDWSVTDAQKVQSQEQPAAER